MHAFSRDALEQAIYLAGYIITAEIINYGTRKLIKIAYDVHSGYGYMMHPSLIIAILRDAEPKLKVQTAVVLLRTTAWSDWSRSSAAAAPHSNPQLQAHHLRHR